MSSISRARSRSAILADLLAEYIYIAIPFGLLVGIKLYSGTWQDVVLSPDWSLGACIIFGQVTFKVSKAVAKVKMRASEQHFGLYTAKRFSFVVVSAVIYCGMIAKPSMLLGSIQVLWFFMASFYHFKDGVAANLIDRVGLDK